MFSLLTGCRQQTNVGCFLSLSSFRQKILCIRFTLLYSLPFISSSVLLLWYFSYLPLVLFFACFLSFSPLLFFACFHSPLFKSFSPCGILLPPFSFRLSYRLYLFTSAHPGSLHYLPSTALPAVCALYVRVCWCVLSPCPLFCPISHTSNIASLHTRRYRITTATLNSQQFILFVCFVAHCLVSLCVFVCMHCVLFFERGLCMCVWKCVCVMLSGGAGEIEGLLPFH